MKDVITQDLAIEVEVVKSSDKPIPKYSITTFEMINTLSEEYVVVNVKYENGAEEKRLYHKGVNPLETIAGIMYNLFKVKNLFIVEWRKGNTPLFTCTNPKSYDMLLDKLLKLYPNGSNSN